METKSKKWYDSTTLGTNLAAIAGAYAAYTQGGMTKQEVVGMAVLALINMILRTKTDSALSK